MTMVNLSPGLIYGPIALGRRAESVSSSTSHSALDGASHGEAQLMVCLATGKVLNKVIVNCVSRIGSPPNYNVGFQTVAGGLPTGNPYGGGAMESYNFNATGYHVITLANPPTTTQGDQIALVVESGAVNPDGSNYIKVQITNTDIYMLDVTEGRYRVGAAWAANPSYRIPIAGALPSVAGMVALNAVNIQEDSYGHATGAERGNKFTMPFTARAIGMWGWRAQNGTATFSGSVYDGAGNELFALGTHSEYIPGNTTEDLLLYFPSPITLTAGQSYYAVIGCHSGTLQGTMIKHGQAIATGDQRYSHPWATDCIYVARTGMAGAFTESEGYFTLTGFVLDQIEMEDK